MAEKKIKKKIIDFKIQKTKVLLIKKIFFNLKFQKYIIILANTFLTSIHNKNNIWVSPNEPLS